MGLGTRAAYYVPNLQGIQIIEPRWSRGFGAVDNTVDTAASVAYVCLPHLSVLRHCKFGKTKYWGDHKTVEKEG